MGKRACLLCAGSQDRVSQIVSWPYSLPRVIVNLLIDLSQGDTSWHDVFVFLSYLVIWRSFLQLWCNRGSSASFKLVFHKNFSTCRCIFDVFVGRGELHILLFCELHTPPLSSYLTVIFIMWIYCNILESFYLTLSFVLNICFWFIWQIFNEYHIVDVCVRST